MMFCLICSDLDLDCDFKAYGKTKESLLLKMKTHFNEKHTDFDLDKNKEIVEKNIVEIDDETYKLDERLDSMSNHRFSTTSGARITSSKPSE